MIHEQFRAYRATLQDDRSITDLSQRYADENEKDYQEFVNAVRSGRLEAIEGV